MPNAVRELIVQTRRLINALPGEWELCAAAGHAIAVAEAAVEAEAAPGVEALAKRITEYLALGGLFNPEMMDHQNVRDLLIDCRAVLATLQPAKPAEPECCVWERDPDWYRPTCEKGAAVRYKPREFCHLCGRPIRPIRLAGETGA